MMQDNVNTEFDRLIQSKVSAARVKPPRRVRDAVASELGIRRSKAPAALVWGCALAAACVLAAIIVRPISVPTSVSPSDSMITADAGSLPLPCDTASTISVYIAGSVSIIHSGKACAEKTDSPLATGSSLASDSPFAADSPLAADSPADAGSHDAADGQETLESSVANAAPSDKTYKLWHDDFPSEDIVESRRRISVSLSGLVGTNDKARSLILSSRSAAPTISTGSYEEISENGKSTYGVPVTVGAGIKMYLTDRWALGTGLQYSSLSRTFDGAYKKVVSGNVVQDESGECRHTLQYAGIPLNLYYDFLSEEFVSLYGFAGADAEKLLSNRYRCDGQLVYKGSSKGFQFSAGLGFGVSFNVADNMSLYIDPSFRYYLDCDQPTSIRTQQPCQFTLLAGLRFCLN